MPHVWVSSWLRLDRSWEIVTNGTGKLCWSGTAGWCPKVYPYPAAIVRGRAYVGGKGISDTGGSLADFLYRNKLTSNTLVVEIKTPRTELLEAAEYRNGVFAPSRELAGATAQVMHYRSTLLDHRLLLSKDTGQVVAPFSP